MEHFKVNRNDIFFILKNQLNYGSLCSLERYKDFKEEMLDMAVTEAITLAREVVDPLQEIGEKWRVKFDRGRVSCAPEFRRAFKQFGEDGWIGLSRDTTYGGQGFPHMMRIVVNDFMYAACQAFNMAPSLTHGAAHLIESFGTDNLKKLFVPRMFVGEWAGTMCLTEPDAGSNLANIRTAAYPEGDAYKIKGSKIFISWGDHDLTENIVHLVLARMEGAPEGVRGISLFIVPKVKVDPDGSLGKSNDVLCERVEEKLGLHASPTCELNFGGHDDCIGFLCGEANQGLSQMFQMMNANRINSGVSGMSLASTAYLNALAYAKARVQGQDVAGRKPGSVPVIDHPDVRRMLLWMKAMVDGMRSMIYTGAFWSDLAWELPGGSEEQRHYQNLLDFITPIIKAYCSHMGFMVCETALQCLGGYGYTKDYPIEQYLRDAKIMSLYEGTNGIQSLDLMGRKMRAGHGALFNAYREELERFCVNHEDHPGLGKEVQTLHKAVKKLTEVALQMAERMKSDPLQWASYTFPALMCFGDVTVAWRLLDLAIIAKQIMDEGRGNAFYAGKVMQASYFAGTMLPLTMVRLDICVRRGREIVEMPNEAF
jgi:alkylation response protein AidB-like acyl-CoA dehydrogenase